MLKSKKNPIVAGQYKLIKITENSLSGMYRCKILEYPEMNAIFISKKNRICNEIIKARVIRVYKNSVDLYYDCSSD